MRLIAALPLLLAACSGTETVGGNNNVDINAAAEQAQDSIDNYAATTAERPATAATPVPDPTPSPTASEAPAGNDSALAPLDPPAPGTPGGLPDDRTPISEAPFAADSAQGAANVVQTYYALLGEKKYRQAWALWGHDGKDSGQSAAAFAASFDAYSEYHANVGAPGTVEAGMSQRWVTVPVQVYARLKRGTPVYGLGTAQLHRIVEGVGGPASQQRWHIRSIDVKLRPKG
jgi:hypothetical protein